MATTQMSRFVQHLRSTVMVDGAGRTDGQLLDSFVRQRDDAALASLVRRYGPMVWGVCCRLLRSHHDAEDAFQATFLVLVQKAATFPDRERVGNWLYGVAHQTAVRMRAIAAKRGVRERQVTVMPELTTTDHFLRNDLQPVLDEELSHLPDKYRVLIVLCDLAGKTRKAVAEQLDVPEGTIASRLATARAILAKRLARRGVIVSGGVLAAVLCQQASAGVLAVVCASTIQAASLLAACPVATGAIPPTVAALLMGATKAMHMTKIKGVVGVLLAVGLVCGGAGLGVGLLNDRTQAAEQTGPKGNSPAEVKQDEASARKKIEDELRKIAAEEKVREAKSGEEAARRNVTKALLDLQKKGLHEKTSPADLKKLEREVDALTKVLRASKRSVPYDPIRSTIFEARRGIEDSLDSMGKTDNIFLKMWELERLRNSVQLLGKTLKEQQK